MPTAEIIPAGPIESAALAVQPQAAAPVAALPQTLAELPKPPPARSPAIVEMPSDEFKKRLDQTRETARAEALSTFYKSIGVADEKEAAELVAAAKKLADEKKTELERRDSKIKELEPFKVKAEAHEKIIARYAKAEMEALPEGQRKAIADLAGDDPGEQLKAIAALRPTWLAPIGAAIEAPLAQTLPPQSTAAPALPIPAGAHTAPLTIAPPAPVPTAQVDHLAAHESLAKTNPYGAARYMNLYNAAIIAAKRQRGDYK